MNLARQRSLRQGRHQSGHPPAGRPTQELAGDRPEERRAPTQELDRPLLCFNTVGTHVFTLDFPSNVSEVVRGNGTMVWGLVNNLRAFPTSSYFRCFSRLSCSG